jgi:hypothetical protein
LVESFAVEIDGGQKQQFVARSKRVGMNKGNINIAIEEEMNDWKKGEISLTD